MGSSRQFSEHRVPITGVSVTLAIQNLIFAFFRFEGGAVASSGGAVASSGGVAAAAATATAAVGVA